MGSRITLLSGLAVLAVVLYACTETHSPRDAVNSVPSGGAYKIGTPYQVAGVWYYPAVDPAYDETGIASWYGAEFHGKPTANGAVYDMNQLTAAHRTLPMPSRVRVTNLENGRTLELTINDRGPFAKGRIIDVSRRGAELLGFLDKGTVRVRVQALSGTRPAVAQTAAAPMVSEPAVPEPSAVQFASAQPAVLQPISAQPLEAIAGAEQIFVQAGAFSSFHNAQGIGNHLATIGKASVTAVEGRPLFRVRLGPFSSHDEAGRILSRVMAAGYPDARVVVD